MFLLYRISVIPIAVVPSMQITVRESEKYLSLSIVNLKKLWLRQDFLSGVADYRQDRKSFIFSHQ